VPRSDNRWTYGWNGLLDPKVCDSKKLGDAIATGGTTYQSDEDLEFELGYLMPPMGENLFLSSYRFGQPITRIYVSTLPYRLMILLAVLLITYVPVMTLGMVELLAR